jgi:hypothetical protein
MRVVPVVLLGLAGCAQLFGLAETTSPDAPAGTVSITFERKSIGASIVTAPLDLTGQTGTYLVADATDPSGYQRIPAAVMGNAFSAIVPMGTPPVELTLPDNPTTPIKRLYAIPNRNILATFAIYEHPNPEPAPSGATLNLSIALPTAFMPTESFLVYSIGTWSLHGVLAAELPGMLGTTLAFTTPYDAAHFNSVSGRPLEKITADDAFLVLRYIGSDLTGVFEAVPFTQTGTDMVTGTMTGNAHAPIDFMVQPAKPGMRFAGVRPAAAGLAMGWGLYASPGYASADLMGPQLMGASVLPADTGAITASYGNPFIGHGWHTVLYWNTYETRTHTDPTTMLPVTLYTGLQQFVEPTSGLLLDLPSGLPISVSVNQTALISDGNSITLDPTKSVDISATFDRATCTFYEIAVLELVPNNAMPMATALVPQWRYFVTTTEQKTKLPPGVLLPSHLYTVRVFCVLGGFPTFTDGNLQNRTLPFSQGYTDSGVFTVAP